MPFLSKDWRSPGEEWIRYEGGWEKRKTVILVPKSDNDSENKVSNILLIKFTGLRSLLYSLNHSTYFK